MNFKRMIRFFTFLLIFVFWQKIKKMNEKNAKKRMIYRILNDFFFFFAFKLYRILRNY